MRPPRKVLNTKTATAQRKKHKRWSSEEDELIRRYIGEYGEHNWSFLEQRFPNLSRPRASCRDRWKFTLRTTVAQHPFSQEEKTRIRRLYQMLGGKWRHIRNVLWGEEYLIKRTEYDIRDIIDQILLEQSHDQDRNPTDQSIRSSSDSNNGDKGEHLSKYEEANSVGDPSLDLSFSIRASSSVVKSIDNTSPATNNSLY